jgi:predicted pyridoxine 5'-phosphate oxidase superfamily flavin-nucleotide-binding protein
MATVSETGWPYVQHRGGPPGFLQVLDAHTLAFADYAGNRQMVSVGNAAVNDRVALILVDYAQARRLKVLGHVRVVELDAEAAKAAPAAPGARVQRMMHIDVAAFDWNCPQHIPRRFEAEDVQRALQERDDEIRRLRQALGQREE